MEKVCHHKRRLELIGPCSNTIFWRARGGHDIYLRAGRMQKKSINSEPYRSRTFTKSPRRNTLAVGSSSSGPAAIAALAGGAHDVASGAPSAIVVVWCVAVPSGVMLDVPCRLSRIYLLYERRGCNAQHKTV